MGLLEGKVAIVTGAGNGIGRCHALALAREGCRVVVNDLGGSRDGSGSSATAADAVVAEVVALGGDAVANGDSVTDFEGCERMVRAAIDRWGRLDIVVNNAGILRDRTFTKMTPADWDVVIDVHLTGTRNVCKAALDPLKAAGGAIINTTSYSGMIGNFGQSNYAAAKAGIYGLTRVLALELKKAGVTVNAVAPVAKTRMTEDISMVADEWAPEQISPIVVWLASDLARSVTGQVFGVQGQRIHLYEVKTNDGVEKAGSDLWTPAEIQERMPDILSWGKPPPAGAPADGGDLVTKVFSHFPAGFRAGAVPGWKAVLHWVVDGATSQTVIVEGDVARVEVGLSGVPTTTVKIGKDTLLDMFQGRIEPAKAFMTGKASADNMGDLMKMGTAFDFKKVAAAFGAADGPPQAAAPTPVDEVGLVFSYFPKGFDASKAPGWKAVLHWVVDGGTNQTVSVDGGVTVRAGLEGTPTTTVKVGKATLLDMFQGRIEPAKAFMTGKASADNMGDLMKMGMAFDFKKIGAAVLADHPTLGQAQAPAPTAAPSAPAARPVGKRYDGGFAFVRRDAWTAYADATDDRNDAYLGPSGMAPPMFHVAPFFPLMMKLATDPALDLDVLRLVHGEHEMRFHRPLRHGEVLQLRGTLASYEEKPSGTVVRYGLLGFVDGAPAVEGATTYFVRAKKKDDAASAPKAPEEPLPAPTWTTSQTIAADQASRYADASGDRNPIHLDPTTARAAGLPGVILHGLCTMAFAQRDLVAQFGAGDPARLSFLGVRFARPVFPGETLTLQAWDQGAGRVAFQTVNNDGKLVISHGRAEFRA
jgi:NAD(P)-dependent dehydrogenase (short-subunit alcohol dehydrogenase family)/acyl dehydratase/putative sterol carrier protein